MIRVLHLGNVASNAYINAKLQRRAGVEADALVDDWNILSQPEWEDAPLDVLRDPEECGRIGRMGRAWIEEHHSSSVVLEKQLAAYENVLQIPPGSAGTGAILHGK